MIYQFSVRGSLVVAGLFLFAAITSLPAQTIQGTVVDLTAQTPVQAAKVSVTNRITGAVGTVLTDDNGEWSFSLGPNSMVDDPRLPLQFAVEQNFPNPFNPMTSIRFAVAQAGLVRIDVRNVLGQVVDEREEFLVPGFYRALWQSKGGAGVYFYTIRSRSATIVKKMIQLEGGQSGGLSTIEKVGSSLTDLQKAASVPITLIVSKFAYVADTLEAVVAGGEQFHTAIETVHSHAILIDLHNDILEKMAADSSYHLGQWHDYNHTDIPRLKSGGVDIQFFAVWVSPTSFPNNPYEKALEFVHIMNTEFAANASAIQQAQAPDEATEINRQGKIAGVIGVEGGHSIENSIDKLKTLYQLGMRYLTITWNNSTDWAVSAKDQRSRTVGLSEFGKQVIRTMDSLGVIIDVSHVGIKTIEDILAVSKNPIIASHSGARALRDHYRNLYDDQIVAIANTGGVIGVVFYPPFLGRPSSQVSLQTVIDHIDYIVRLVGIDHVALGSDFDGIESTPIGLEDTTKFPDLTLALLKKGYTREDVEKILGGNFMRVFKQVCGASQTHIASQRHY